VALTIFFEVCADYENNSETWWDELRRCEPAIAERFDRVDAIVELSLQEFERLTDLPGWDDDDAPAYAEHPLLVTMKWR
jgi:hypothetical protein